MLLIMSAPNKLANAMGGAIKFHDSADNISLEFVVIN